MIPEIAILKLFIENAVLYNKYYSLLDIKRYKELNIVYKTLDSFHSKEFPKTVDDFVVYFFGHYPRLKPEEVDAYNAIFDQCKASTVAVESLEGYLRNLSERASAFSVAQQAIDYAEGRTTRESYSKAIGESLEPTNELMAPEPSFITDSLADLKDELVSKPGLRWRLSSLNKSLGSLRKGDFGFVFARPETGKTTFLASEVTYFASQVAAPILWFNNEEQGNKVKLRCFQAALGLNLPQLFANVKKNQEDYNKLVRGNIRILADDGGTLYKTEIERVCEQMQPSLIIFDQIDKIKGFAADRNDLMMGAIYQWARELAKKYAPVIGVCQADGTGEFVKWLTMAHVADAKTAKQAEADWILGIGRSQIEGVENVRHAYISKNKLTGDEDTEAELRHAKFDIWIHPEIARYSDVGNMPDDSADIPGHRW